MKKIISALVVSSVVLVTANTKAQTKQQPSTTTQSTISKDKAPVTTGSTKQNPSPGTTDQSKLPASELAVKVTDWMKTNIGEITDAQAGRINVATTNLLNKVRDIRTNVTDPDTRKYQIHLAMQTYNGQITSVLSSEQNTTYKAKKKQLVTDFNEFP